MPKPSSGRAVKKGLINLICLIYFSTKFPFQALAVISDPKTIIIYFIETYIYYSQIDIRCSGYCYQKQKYSTEKTKTMTAYLKA